jgi:hypothetical protein
MQDNLKYEGSILTDKLMKLRASRHDLETELFALKNKRIQLLDVIRKLEDEEMQLVSEVGAWWAAVERGGGGGGTRSLCERDVCAGRSAWCRPNSALAAPPHNPPTHPQHTHTLTHRRPPPFQQVSGIVAHKRAVLAEVPHFEARARASAGLAVVQDYLLASVQYLSGARGDGGAAGGGEGAHAGAAAAAAAVAATASAPSWSGTAQVPRPSATWDM